MAGSEIDVERNRFRDPIQVLDRSPVRHAIVVRHGQRPQPLPNDYGRRHIVVGDELFPGEQLVVVEPASEALRGGERLGVLLEVYRVDKGLHDR
jgi:hypothetical protein